MVSPRRFNFLRPTHHGRSNASRITGCLLSLHILDRGVAVFDDDGSDFSIHFEEAFPSTLLGVQSTDGKELDDEHLALFNFNAHLLVDLRLSEEVSSGNDTVRKVNVHGSEGGLKTKLRT